MSYSVGDKFIIEIDEILEDENHLPFEDKPKNKLYRIKNFKSLVFDENGLNKLTKFKDSVDTIGIGDEVVGNGVTAVVVGKYSTRYYYLLFSDGSCGMHEIQGFKKTGRHIEIKTITSQIGEK